jgi:hypothetical protein
MRMRSRRRSSPVPLHRISAIFAWQFLWISAIQNLKITGLTQKLGQL